MKKLFTIGVVLTTILWTMGVAAFIPVASATALVPGDLIKKADSPAVYYYAADETRYTFSTANTYFSWYEGFDGIKTIDADDLAAIDISGNVVVRPGTNLVEFESITGNYAVEPEGMIREVTAEVAEALYGADWETLVILIQDGFYPDYTKGADLEATAYPVGTLVQEEGETSVNYVNADGSWSAVEDEVAFDANGWNWDYLVTATVAMPSAGAAITEALYNDTSQGGGAPDPTPTGGDLDVSLNGDTAIGGTIPTSSLSEFTSFDFSAGSTAVEISSIKLSASGLGTATNIDDVTLYLDNAKVGTTKNMNSDGEATFNFPTPLEVGANATKTLTVKASAASAGYYILGIESADDISSDAGSVDGSFAIWGNQMYADSSTTIGTVTLSNIYNGGTTTNYSFGEDDVVIAGFDLEAVTEDAMWESMQLRNGGTNTEGIISNLRLFVNGDEIATGEYDGTNIIFNEIGQLLEKSDPATIEIYADLGVTNSGDSVMPYIKNRADLAFTGQTYGFGVQLTTATFNLLDAAAETADTNLVTGDVSLNMDKSATPAKDVKPGTNNVVLATFSVTSNGEDATLEQIADGGATGTTQFEIQGSGLTASEIENIEMVDVDTNGVYDITETYSATVDGTNPGWNLSMTDEIYLAKGVTKTFQVRADLSEDATTGIDDGDTLQVIIDGSQMTITGEDSNSSLTDITPSSVSSAITTAKTAALTITTTALNAKSVVPSTSDVVIYQGSAKAGSADDVKLKTFKLTDSSAPVDDFDDNEITKLDLYLDGVLIKSISNQIVESDNTTAGYVTFNSLITTDDANVIPAGTTVNLIVKATFASTLTTTGAFSLLVNAVGDVTSRSVVGNDSITASVTSTALASRVITVASVGTLKVALQTTSVKADEDSYLLAGSALTANRYLGALEFTTQFEPIVVQELRLEADGTARVADIAEVRLVDGAGTVIVSVEPEANGDAEFLDWNKEFPADSTTTYYISVVAKGMNVLGDATSTATAGTTVQYHINPLATTDNEGVVAVGGSTGASVIMALDAGGSFGQGEWDSAAGTSGTSKTANIQGAILNSIEKNMDNSALTGGIGVQLAGYTFVFENGDNRKSDHNELKAIMRDLTLTVSKSAGVLVTNVQAYLSSAPGTKVTLADAAAGQTCDGAPTSCVLTFNTTNSSVLTDLVESGEVDGEVTLIVVGTVATSSTVDEYFQTSIADLDGASNDDFYFYGDGGTTVLTNMFLPVKEVIGAKIYE
jgi:hypothetical protein